VVESCILVLFISFYTKIHFNQAFIVKTPCSYVYFGDFGKILCTVNRAPQPTLTPPKLNKSADPALIKARAGPG
jgi:hypothetical protein